MRIFHWIQHWKNVVATTILYLVCFRESSAQGQDCVFHLTKESGTFETPGFPEKYPNNTQCIWNIHVEPGRFILLSFHIFEIESHRGKCTDIVEVKDGSTPTDELLGIFCDSNRPPKVITSSTNSLRVWFLSDQTKEHRGFNASYTSQLEQGCGGFLSNTSGSISSPRFPEYPYPNSLQCDWIITLPSGKFIRVEFSSDYEVEVNCGTECECVDRLELWDGPEFNETRVGSFCLSIPPLLVSKSNRMRLRFITNGEGRFKGFGLSYTTSITPGCGGDITGDKGVILSPNFPESFPAFSDCVWRILAPADRYISFRFEEFTGINGTNSECSVDSVEVREGFTREGKLQGRYCMQNVPPVIVIKGNELFIHFQERGGTNTISFVDKRFKGSFLTHSTACNESIGLQDGRIRDSQLSASSYFSLTLGRGQLYMTPQYGRVGNAYAWCSQIEMSNKAAPEYLQIDLLNLTEVTAIATQGYHLPSTAFWGYVSSYKVHYGYNGNHWITYRNNQDLSLNRGFTEFTGNANVSDFKKNVLSPTIIATKIRILPISFKSNPGMCLRVELYGCSYDQGCGGIISLEKQGKINARGSNKQPKTCRWLSIPSPPSSFNVAVHFHFTYFDIPCHHGQLTVQSRNGRKKEVFCGVDPPPVSILRSTSQIALEMQLKKGSDVTGFDLHYSTESLGCGAILEVLQAGTLVSPRYPFPYQHNQNCTWFLNTKPGYKVTLEFTEFDLQPSYDKKCRDFVQIQDGTQESSPVLGKFCGKHIPDKVTSTFNNIRITFHKDVTFTAKGFVLHYRVISTIEIQATSSSVDGSHFYSSEFTIRGVNSTAPPLPSGQQSGKQNRGCLRETPTCSLLLCLLCLLMCL
ncbi:cubilin-like [Acropora palmata]|uniref:cubilin-like n=1 Tax=Acropora palmata TaxID=6131 RepID=UPI003DA008EA